jgi:hypothetical protein
MYGFAAAVIGAMTLVVESRAGEIRGLTLHQGCFQASSGCDVSLPELRDDSDTTSAFVSGPLLKLTAPVSWSICPDSPSTNVCFYFSQGDLDQWNTLYSAKRRVLIAFVIDDRIIAMAIVTGPVINPVKVNQLDGKEPPLALQRYLHEHEQ